MYMRCDPARRVVNPIICYFDITTTKNITTSVEFCVNIYTKLATNFDFCVNIYTKLANKFWILCKYLHKLYGNKFWIFCTYLHKLGNKFWILYKYLHKIGNQFQILCKCLHKIVKINFTFLTTSQIYKFGTTQTTPFTWSHIHITGHWT